MIKVEELTFAYIQKFCDFEKDIVLTNHFHTDWEADILVINQEGFSHEIEIKLSKSDFKNDFKKFYQNQNSGEKFLKHDKIGCGDMSVIISVFYCQWEWLHWKKFPSIVA